MLAFTDSLIKIGDYRGYSVLTPFQGGTKDYQIDSLFIALLTNGDASVDYNLVVNTNKSSTNVKLFGEAVQNLTLTDYNETNITYESTGLPNEITVFAQNSSDLHVTYTTSDLVDKQNRNWTFSFSFPDKFLLKMPSRSHIIHMEPPAFLTPTDDQNLWGFGPGNVEISYVIGPLGIREEAQASIRSLEDGIQDARSNYNGIVLVNATNLLESARSNFKQGKYLETVTNTNNALTYIEKISQKFILANDAISQAERDIQNNKKNGYDTSQAEVTLSSARDLFNAGNYEKVEVLAKEATRQVERKSVTLLGFDNYIFIGIIGSFTAIAFIMYFVIRKRKIPSQKTREDHNSANNINNHNAENVSIDGHSFAAKEHNASPIHFNTWVDSPHDGVEIKDYLEKVVKEVGNVRKNQEQQQHDMSPVGLPSSGGYSVNNETLIEIVSKMKEQKPYLRNEDKGLLDFLCDKQGSAFESEIRSKFILPRTSLWRLIKRLEREELVEVRKIGGQNLIKLRFEAGST